MKPLTPDEFRDKLNAVDGNFRYSIVRNNITAALDEATKLYAEQVGFIRPAHDSERCYCRTAEECEKASAPSQVEAPDIWVDGESFTFADAEEAQKCMRWICEAQIKYRELATRNATMLEMLREERLFRSADRNELGAQIDDLRQRLTSAEGRAANLLLEANTLVSHAEADRDYAQAQLTTALEERDKAREEYKQLVAECHLIISRDAPTEATWTSWNCATVPQRLTLVIAKYRRLRTKLAEVEKERGSLLEDKAQLLNDTDTVRGQRETLIGELEKARTESLLGWKKVDSLGAELEKVRGEKERVEAERDNAWIDLDQRLSPLQAEVSRLTEELQAQRTLNRIDSELLDSKDDQLSLAMKLADLLQGPRLVLPLDVVLALSAFLEATKAGE